MEEVQGKKEKMKEIKKPLFYEFSKMFHVLEAKDCLYNISGQIERKKPGKEWGILFVWNIHLNFVHERELHTHI